jgi:hypothetical protein
MTPLLFLDADLAVAFRGLRRCVLSLSRLIAPPPIASRTQVKAGQEAVDDRRFPSSGSDIGTASDLGRPRLRSLLQTAWIHFEHLLSARDRLVAALVAPMAHWARAIGG